VAGFAVWITGLPASGKSTITRALVRELAGRGVEAAVLESDVLRSVMTPHPTYSDEERKNFYAALVYIGALLARHGVPVIFDATANRRVYRAAARSAIGDFVEVFVDSPLDVCVARDPKGIYRTARAGGAKTVPGVQTPYEAPERPDVVVSGEEPPDRAARAIVRVLEDRGYLVSGSSRSPSSP
jgi:adenylylsulfate kinase